MGQLLRILHLEDIATDAELIERQLKKSALNFEITVVDNRQSYIEALEKFRPDIVLSDNSLPSFNAMGALNILQQLKMNIPFILVTGNISEEFVAEIIKSGATDYILKDRLQRLPNAIASAIDKFRLEKEKQQFIAEIIANESLLKTAERMAHIGSFSVDKRNVDQNKRGVDKTDDIVKWSDEAYNIFCFEKGGVKPSFANFMQCIHPEDREMVAKRIQDAELSEGSLKVHYRIIDKEGNEKYIYSEMVIERDEKQLPLVITGFVHDVTDINLAAQLLQKSEANLKTIFDNTDTGYMLLTPDRKIISFNNKANFFTLEFYGRELREGSHLHEYLSGKRTVLVEQAFEIAARGENTSYETSFFDKDGNVKWYYSRWFGTMNEDRVNLGVIVAISDITHRKLAELETERIAHDLIQRNNTLEQFAFMVSHNLRAPVANIMSLTEVLSTWNEDKPGKDIFLDALSASSKKLDEVVVDLNHILRISHGVNKEKEVVYFQQLVEDVKVDLDYWIKKEMAVIKTDFTKVMNIYSLRSHLRGIFFNLISNSINYKRPFVTPVIEISSRSVGSNVELTFKDNGKGIDLEKHGKQLFGLYQRFDTSVEGKGIGLCMVKTKVETLGGVISVQSDVNKGTIFTIELPF